MVCAERTIGSNIILDAPDATPRCMVCTKRTIGSDIVLDAPDGTPRRHGSCGILFGPFGDGVSVDVR